MLKITITRSGLAAIGKRGFQAAGREAVRAAGEKWWRTFLPLHFSNIAFLRYDYARRDRRTNRLKREREPWPFGEDKTPAIGESKPLVFTGRSRKAALSSQNIKAKAKNYQTYRADVIINAPAFNFGRGKRIDMRDEVTRINPQEVKTLEKVFAKEWERQLVAQGLSAPKRRKVAA